MYESTEAAYYAKLISGLYAKPSDKSKAVEATFAEVLSALEELANDQIAVKKEGAGLVIWLGSPPRSPRRVFGLGEQHDRPALYPIHLNEQGFTTGRGQSLALDFVYFSHAWWSAEPIAGETKPDTGRGHRTAAAVILEAIYKQVATLS